MVQVLLPQPVKGQSSDCLFFFAFPGYSTTSSSLGRGSASLPVADEDVLPRGENKEYRDALQASETTMFSTGDARRSLARKTRRSLVQVLLPQPVKGQSSDCLFFFAFPGYSTTSSSLGRGSASLPVADEDVLPRGENKEYRDALQASETTMFSTGDARRSLARKTRRSLVQVLLPQPVKGQSSDCLFFFAFPGYSTTSSSLGRGSASLPVADEDVLPRGENKEYRDALQASETTMFSTGDARRSLARKTRRSLVQVLLPQP